jgi:hypothetical protein
MGIVPEVRGNIVLPDLTVRGLYRATADITVFDHRFSFSSTRYLNFSIRQQFEFSERPNIIGIFCRIAKYELTKSKNYANDPSF